MPIKIEQIKPVSATRKNTLITYKPIIHEHCDNNANNIMRNNHFSYWNKLIFSILDKINPIITQYPKFGDRIVTVAQKMIKSENIIK